MLRRRRKMIAKCGNRLAHKCDYTRLNYYMDQHRSRYIKRVETTNDSMPCQDCDGYGGYTEIVTDSGEGPFYECAWCYGTSRVTRWVRGKWLRYRKAIK